MAGFLIQYDGRTADRTVTFFPGTDGYREAIMLGLELEARRTNEDVEIVALDGESLETVQRAHAEYFDGRAVDAF